MDPRQPTTWIELVDATRDAGSADALLQLALPLLQRAAGATAAAVVRDEAVVAGAAPGGDVRDLVLPPDSDPAELHDIDLPRGWSAAGIERAAARRLPGDAGALLLAWSKDASAVVDDDLHAVLALLEAGLARLAAETHLADLVHRVDNAQHLANMGDYDWHIASDTNRWSDQLYRIYGHEPQSFQPSYDVFLSNIHPDDRERIKGIHQRAYATGEPYQMIERIVRPDGQVRYLSSNGQVIMDEHGTPERMRGTCIDITDRVLAEQAREHSAALFRDLVESAPDAILVLDAQQTVVQANGRAGDLLGGDPTGRPTGDFFTDALEAGEGQHARRLDGSSVTVDVTMTTLRASAEPQLTAVFLRDSAQRLAGEAEAAWIGESQQRRRAALEVNDNVVQGLTAAVMSLEAGDDAASASYLERTLAAARTMMDELLAPLAGAGLEPGDVVRGSPPTLTRQAPREPGEPTASTAGRRRVLLVDDADDIRLLLRMKLESMDDYEVVAEAADGVTGVEHARELQPDLVVLDMAMPVMDGLEALPLIRSAAPEARVIVFSGFNEATMAEQALAAGAHRYVVKGCAMSELAKAIDEVLAPAQP